MRNNREKKWKPVSCDVSSFSPSDFSSFGGIEELTDYEIINQVKNKKCQDDGSRKEKKRKRKKSPKDEENDVELTEQKSVELSTEDIDFEPLKKKARKSVQRKQKCDTEEEKEEIVQKSVDDIDMSAWYNLHIPEGILAALKELGFQKPTTIQELALPAAIRDHLDILAAAETGSGKTLAFGIPMIAHIKEAKDRESESSEKESKLRGLVLAPTRELAIQVRNHLQDVSKYMDVKIIAVVGGMSQEKQRRLLKRCPDIIVATPGRLWQLMGEGEPYLENIPYVRYLVIDEADRMVEQGHFEELKKLLEMMNDYKEDKRRQTFVFSATLTLIHDLPKRLEIKKEKVKSKSKLGPLMKLIGIREKSKVIDITKKTGVVETLSESQIICKLEEKDLYLYYFKVMYPARTLVFCNSISCVRRLKNVFEQLGCNPLALHASMHQRQRLKNLDTFASSKEGLLLATDVAARGLDIKGIDHVVHFQVPRTAEIYIHRSGRTARAEKEGVSLILIDPQEAVFYKNICRTLKRNHSLPSFPIDQNVLKTVKERVELARKIDLLEHRQKRLIAQNNWFLKAAEEMEVDIEDEGLLNELGDDHEKAMKLKQLKLMKKQLKLLLTKQIMPKAFLGSYPTKSGKLKVPKEIGTKRAVEILRKDHAGVNS